jgi:hypothetical protein
MKNERGPDPGYSADTDFQQTQRLIAREAARAAIEIQSYTEGGGRRPEKQQTWQNWILGIVGTLISLGVGALIFQMSEVKANVAAIAATQNTSLAATNQRLEADERRIETLERKVFQ